MQRPLLTTFPIIVLACALTACGGGGGGDSSSGDSPPPGDSSGSSSTGTAPVDGGNGSGAAGGQTAYTVTPSVYDTGGAISPSTAVMVPTGTTTSFTLTPNTGYAVSSVGGTCGGTLSGNTYTTAAVNANCTVVAAFAQTSAGASITNCFTVPNSVSFAMYSAAGNAGSGTTALVTAGPATFNGQAATMQSTYNVYWTVSSSGVQFLGYVPSNGTAYTANPPGTIPLNIQPGQFVDFNFDYRGFVANGGSLVNPSTRHTFVGFENITLGSKTFANACHFQVQQLASNGTVDQSSAPIDEWYEFGYGLIKESSTAYTRYYVGDSLP